MEPHNPILKVSEGLFVVTFQARVFLKWALWWCSLNLLSGSPSYFKLGCSYLWGLSNGAYFVSWSSISTVICTMLKSCFAYPKVVVLRSKLLLIVLWLLIVLRFRSPTHSQIRTSGYGIGPHPEPTPGKPHKASDLSNSRASPIVSLTSSRAWATPGLRQQKAKRKILGYI